jgi:hypothetical protein
MASLADLRCQNHAQREAVARCVACHGYFCRECVSEHDDRILCAACLKRAVARPASRRRALIAGVRVAELAAGLLILWLCFYALGKALLSLPHEFHEGKLWTAEEN